MPNDYPLYIKPDRGPVSLVMLDRGRIRNAGNEHPRDSQAQAREIARQIQSAFGTLHPSDHLPALQRIAVFIDAADMLGRIDGIISHISGDIVDPQMQNIKIQMKELKTLLQTERNNHEITKRELIVYQQNPTVPPDTIRRFQQQITDLKGQLVDKESTIGTLNQQIQAISTMNEDLNNKLGVLQTLLEHEQDAEKIKALQQQITDLNGIIATQRQNLGKQHREIDDLQRAKEQLENDLARITEERDTLLKTVHENTQDNPDPDYPNFLHRYRPGNDPDSDRGYR